MCDGALWEGRCGEWQGKLNMGTQKNYQGQTKMGDHKFIMTLAFMALWFSIAFNTPSEKAKPDCSIEKG